MSDPGRPTAYKAHFAELAHNYCLLGATNEELGRFLGVSISTIDNWIANKPDFETSVHSGRDLADSIVARRMYQRAIGYDYKAIKLMHHRGETKEVEHKVHMPPDPYAGAFWLRNRRRRYWADRSPRREAEAANWDEFDAIAEQARRDDAA